MLTDVFHRAEALRCQSRTLRLGLAALATVVANDTSTAQKTESIETPPPNILLIIADDHGYPYLRAMGDKTVITPNIDRLVEGGTTFRIGYNTGSVCQPSLATLLNGSEPYPRSYGRRQNLGPAAESSLPALLTKRGYKSFQAGKYWGTNYTRGGFSGGTKGKDLQGGKFVRAMGGAEGLKVGQTTMAPVYDFLNEVGDDPFFLWFAPALPHGPWDPPERYRELYRDAPIDATAVEYYATLSWLDDSVGNLVDYLEHRGLRENTLIVYLSDNGMGPFDFEQYPTSGPRSKSTMFELGLRTPIAFNWPGHVPAGVLRDDLVSTLDLYPTLLDYAGIVPPTNRSGRDIRKAIDDGTPVGRDAIVGRARGRMPGFETKEFEENPKTPKLAYFVRDRRWHYVWYNTLGLEVLFDLHQDPKELVDVASEHPDVIERFREKIEAWKSEPAPGSS